ncbi:restriction endonuclease subunit S domain-containing protein [Mycolicibacterium cosmeticum]|uniref:Type I restriction modification DNA specificity domain protein n=1 Tax=Mycolicibacterium cosmeticum TaxID=258533 RepID=W9AYF8_MYCCO|nr:restriction endonuclease subunit S [Mycolicibacterium cosmeticum]CDO07972.1 Type I restriction modification DNA specificity domain protein [Mycolicibacterium cosmeticum]
MNEVTLGDLIAPANVRRAGCDELPVLSITMRSGLVDQSTKFKKRVASSDTSDYKVVRRGQLVVGFPIDEGVLDFQTLYPEAIVSPAYGIWDLKDSRTADVEYLRRYLRSPRAMAYYKGKLRGSTARRRSLPSTVFRALDVPLPALDDQRRIAAILHRIELLNTRQEEAARLVDDFANAVFDEIVGGVTNTVQLGDIAQFYGGTTLPDGIPFTGQSDGAFLMKVSDMNLPGNEEEVASCALWSRDTGPKASTCPPGAVILPKRGGAISTNKKRRATRPTILDPNLMGVAPLDGRLRTSFLLYWFKRFDLASLTSGSTVPQLNKRDLAPLEFPLATLRDQDEFEHRLTSIHQHGRLLRSRSAYLAELLTSLQSRAFSGHL